MPGVQVECNRAIPSCFLSSMDVVGQSSDEYQSHPDVAALPARRPRERRLPGNTGSSCLFFLLASAEGFWHQQTSLRARGAPTVDGVSEDEIRALRMGGIVCVGAVVGSWSLCIPDPDSGPLPWVVTAAMHMVSDIEVFGMITYVASGSVCFHEPFDTDADATAADIMELARLAATTDGGDFGGWVAQKAYTRVVVLSLCPVVALAAARGSWRHFHAAAVTRRTNRRRLCEHCAPSSKALRHFLKQAEPSQLQRAKVVRVRRGPRWRQQILVEQIIKWVKAVRFLKDG